MDKNLARDTWHTTHANIVTLFHCAVEQGFEVTDLEYLVSNPWKYWREFVLAYCSEADRERSEKMRLVRFSRGPSLAKHLLELASNALGEPEGNIMSAELMAKAMNFKGARRSITLVAP